MGIRKEYDAFMDGTKVEEAFREGKKNPDAKYFKLWIPVVVLHNGVIKNKGRQGTMDMLMGSVVDRFNIEFKHWWPNED